MLQWTVCGVRCSLSFGFGAVLCAGFVFASPAVTGTALFAIALHELGHLAALWLLRRPPTALRMTAFGLEITGGEALGYRQAALVSLAGPAANLLGAAVCGAAALFIPQAALPAFFCAVLGLFHLLPVLPLDGGQALQALLCLRMAPRRAAGRCTLLSAALLLPLGTMGFRLLFCTQPNPTLIILCFYLLFYLVFGQKE